MCLDSALITESMLTTRGSLLLIISNLETGPRPLGESINLFKQKQVSFKQLSYMQQRNVKYLQFRSFVIKNSKHLVFVLHFMRLCIVERL